MRHFSLSNGSAKALERISNDAIESAFKSQENNDGKSGLFQLVDGRWFQARIREEPNKPGSYEIENWIPVNKPNSVLSSAAKAAGVDEVRPPQVSASRVAGARSTADSGRKDPQTPAERSINEQIEDREMFKQDPQAREVAAGIHATPNLKDTQSKPHDGQPAPGSSTPQADTQGELAAKDHADRSVTGQQQPTRTDAGKPAQTTPNAPQTGAVRSPAVQSAPRPLSDNAKEKK